MVFGILTLLLGCLAGLFVPLMLFGQMMAAKAPNAPPTNTAAILPAVVIYGCLAAALIWLGIGSIKARRWARALFQSAPRPCDRGDSCGLLPISETMGFNPRPGLATGATAAPLTGGVANVL
jgi:hypothetical protein